MNVSDQRIKIFLLLAPFLVWVFLCRDFILCRIFFPTFESYDASAYYQHIRFFLENIQQGIYPLWDPIWEFGVPNTFFLRRIGEFNPFLYLVLLLTKTGWPYPTAYFIFLAFYFWLGLLGYYLVACKIFKKTQLAWCAYLLLLFSTLGIKLFSSYIILLFVPTVWFFYFLISFAQNPERHSLVGLTLTLMLTVTTYLPFYFITIVLFFFLLLLLFYSKETLGVLPQIGRFARRNKFLVAFCLIVLALSSIPGIELFRTMKDKELVLPMRHGTDTTTNPLQVDLHRLEVGGIAWLMVKDHLFFEPQLTKITSLYIPYWAFLLLVMGAFVKINRRLFFWAAWGLAFFFLTLTDATPFHRFCYEHIFYFRYFRNLQYFLWILILPVFILAAVDFLGLLIATPPSERTPRARRTFLVLTAHLMLLGLAYFNRLDILPSTFLLIFLSAIFFLGYYAGWFPNVRFLFPILVGLLVIPQSWQIYHFLIKNTPHTQKKTNYDLPYQKFEFKPRDHNINFNLSEAATLTRRDFYYGSPTTLWLCQNVDDLTLRQYTRYRLSIVDHVEILAEENPQAPALLTYAFRGSENVAFIPPQQAPAIDLAKLSGLQPKAQFVRENSKEFSVIAFAANSLTIKTNFDRTRFLVYNDSYDKGWSASINGNKVPLFRANITFKGVLVPPGEATVEFRYGTRKTLAFRYFLIGLFFFVLFILVKTAVTDHRKRNFLP